MPSEVHGHWHLTAAGTMAVAASPEGPHRHSARCFLGVLIGTPRDAGTLLFLCGKMGNPLCKGSRSQAVPCHAGTLGLLCLQQVHSHGQATNLAEGSGERDMYSGLPPPQLSLTYQMLQYCWVISCVIGTAVLQAGRVAGRE